jgi:calcineurin-like phosphoesterase family protein
MKSRRIAIPDVHGCLRTLRRLVEEVVRLERGDTLYLLGDLIDRGPDARGVVDYLMALQAREYRVAVVRGNHEQMLLDACHNRDDFRLWLLNGGRATLESFGVDDACELPISYRRFFASLPLYLVLPDFVLVHGGINCAAPDPFADLEAMLWCRSCPVDRARLGGRRVVSGHTPCRREEVLASLATDRLTLDNGCVYLGSEGLGALTALDLDQLTVSFQENCEGESGVRSSRSPRQGG